MDRVILHCDCNSFFASVELREHPELKDKPVAVGRDDGSRHGIILAKNEAAKRFDIKTTETIWQAKRKCPELILLEPHHEKYSQMCTRINKIYGDYTDLVEPFSVDESWLDVTGSLHLFAQTGEQLADLLRARVQRELGITISVGVSYNKVFAKLGSDYKKPNATTVITRENAPALLWPLPVETMLFVGKAASARLRGMGITTIGALANADPVLLGEVLGKMGAMLHAYAAGQDDAPVRAQGDTEQVKSVGNGLTFRRDLVGSGDIRTGVGYLTEEVARRLRRQGLLCTTVQVSIKDPALKTIQRQMQLAAASDLAREISAAALALIAANWPPGKPIRALTITASGLTDQPPARQTSLFDDPAAPEKRAQQKSLETTLDNLRGRFGKGAVAAARVLGSDLGLVENKAKPGGGHGDREQEEELAENQNRKDDFLW